MWVESKATVIDWNTHSTRIAKSCNTITPRLLALPGPPFNAPDLKVAARANDSKGLRAYIYVIGQVRNPRDSLEAGADLRQVTDLTSRLGLNIRTLGLCTPRISGSQMRATQV